MLEPGFYPHRPERVELRETHTSWVFLAADLAYKVKKPVIMPFLDYGSVERRRAMCREEVKLNRRLAPAYYLGVSSIVRGPDGLRLVESDEPGAAEYAVKMRRVPEERTVESLVRSQALSGEDADAVAARIAAFHSTAEAAPPEASRPTALWEPFDENLRTLREVGAALPEERLVSAERFTDAFRAARGGQIADRAGAGLVRDCHGDLRAEHVIVAEEVQVYDCIEFNPSLRWIDVAADLAFLVMDMARLGREDLAARLVSAYRDSGGDPGDGSLINFYASYRAWVRAKVECLRAREAHGQGHEDEARHLLALGHRLAWRARMPAVIAVCGVAASGKTLLASRLCEVSGLRHLSSDVTRKRLAGLAPTQRAAPEHYTEEFTRRTYEELGRLAGVEVERRGGAVVDATFHRARHRGSFSAGLGAVTAPVLFARCEAPAGVLLERAASRAAGPPAPSDADPAIVERQLAAFEPLDEVAPERQSTVRTTRPLEAEVVDVEDLANRRLAWNAPS